MGQQVNKYVYMTEKEIVNGFCNFILKDKSANKIFPNIFFDNYEADLLEITKSGYSYEYEVKISRSDFKNDVKKSCGWILNESTNFKKVDKLKIDEIKEGRRTNYFYYLVPKNLIQVDEIPEYAGLIYVELSEIKCFTKEKGYYTREKIFCQTIKEAPKLASEKFSEKKLLKCLESTYYRFHKLRQNND